MIIVGAVLTMLLSSCGKSALRQFDIVYEVTFEADWSSSTHPISYPSNAHFSPMVIVSHPQSVAVFTEGLAASPGVKQVAETGATDLIEEELRTLINQSLALDQAKGKRIDSPGSNKELIGVGIGYSHVTVMSMIAPSPDWYVGATTNLIDPADGEWFDEVTVDVLTYDSGTDMGSTFTSPDMPNDVVDGVTMITGGPLANGGTSVENMGRFIFRRVQ